MQPGIPRVPWDQPLVPRKRYSISNQRRVVHLTGLRRKSSLTGYRGGLRSFAGGLIYYVLLPFIESECIFDVCNSVQVVQLKP